MHSTERRGGTTVTLNPPLSPLRVAPGGRYFETAEGSPFLFIGPNDAVTWQGLQGLFQRRNLAEAEAYLADLAAHGINMLRLMLEYCHHDGYCFESPVGHFNPDLVQLWDDLFALCERHGMRVLLAPWDNFWMARRWHRHPYNHANGGPAHGPAAFFTDEATIQATERRFQFVIERWGGSPALAAWDLFNEIDPYWGGGPAEQHAVISRLSHTIREAERRLWGFTRLQTVSVFGPRPSEGYEALIFRHPDLDFATTHIYSEGAIDYPFETVAPAVAMARWVRHALERVAPGRPYMDTEHGPIHMFNDHNRALPEAFDDEYERHLAWAHLASGGAGSGMRWPARDPHLLTPGTKRMLRGMAAFADLLAWGTFAPQDANAEVEVGACRVIPFACRDEQQAIIWLLRDKPPHQAEGMLPERPPLEDVPLSLHGLARGRYRVTLWDTRAGSARGELRAEVADDGRLPLTIPELPNDLALAVRPAPEA